MTNGDWKWGNLIVECLRNLRDSQPATAAFVDWEVIPPFTGSPAGIFVWFICDTRSSTQRFRQTLTDSLDQLKAAAASSGFPSDALNTLTADVTSEEEIQAAGGRFQYFR